MRISSSFWLAKSSLVVKAAAYIANSSAPRFVRSFVLSMLSFLNCNACYDV